MESSGRTAPTTAHPSSGTGCAVVVVAAGSGQRLGRGIPKALVELAGRAILEHSLRAVLDSGVCAEGGRIVVTVPAGDEQLSAVCRELGAQPVTGPQGFDWRLLRRVNEQAVAKGADELSLTDDASLVERWSEERVIAVQGHEESFKITRPLDLLLAEAVLAERRQRLEARPEAEHAEQEQRP